MSQAHCSRLKRLLQCAIQSMTLRSFTDQHKNNPKNLNSSVDKRNISTISFKMWRFNKFWLESTHQISLSLWRNAVNSTSGNEASNKLMKHWMWRNVCLSRGRNCTPWNTSRISQLCSLIDDRYWKTQQTNGMISTNQQSKWGCILLKPNYWYENHNRLRVASFDI